MSKAKDLAGQLASNFIAMDGPARLGYLQGVVRNLVDTDEDVRAHGKFQATVVINVLNIEAEELRDEVS